MLNTGKGHIGLRYRPSADIRILTELPASVQSAAGLCQSPFHMQAELKFWVDFSSNVFAYSKKHPFLLFAEQLCVLRAVRSADRRIRRTDMLIQFNNYVTQ